MTEELNHGFSNPDTSFEREDLSTRGVFVFMVGLAVVGIVIYFIVVGMYRFLDHYEHSQMKTASPLETSMAPADRVVTKAYMEKFKDNGTPMLESDERGQFKDFLLKQEDQLNSYGWVDQQAGIAHIPIERAINLIVERGLPVRPAGGAEGNAAAAAAPSTKKSVPKQ